MLIKQYHHRDVFSEQVNLAYDKNKESRIEVI